MKLISVFKETLKRINANKKIILIVLILIGLITFNQFIKKSLIILIFIVLASISKIYYRFVKSSIGIDLVFFLTMMLAIVYSPILAIIFGIITKFTADYIANRFSHTTIITLTALIIPILVSTFLVNLPLITVLFILTILFEVISSLLYYFIGSSPGSIVLYALTHLMFNAFLILNIAPWLKTIM